MGHRIVTGAEVAYRQELTVVDLATGDVADPRLLIYTHILSEAELLASLKQAIDINPYVAGRVLGLKTGVPVISAANQGLLFSCENFATKTPLYGINKSIASIDEVRDFCHFIKKSDVDEYTPLVQIKLSRFLDGSILTFVRPHFFSDAISMWRFIYTWAALCRGAAPPTFQFNRQPINQLFKRTTAFKFLTRTDSVLSVSAERRPAAAFVKKVFRLPSAVIDSLEKLVVRDPSDSQWVSRQDLVMAYFWRHLAVCFELDRTALAEFILLRNTRTILALQPDYFGNAIAKLRYSDSLVNIQQKTLLQVAQDIRRQVKSQTPHSITGQFNRGATHGSAAGRYGLTNTTACVAKVSVVFNNCSKFPVYDIDFGLGRPCWNDIVRDSPPHREVLIFNTPMLDGGVDCHVNLPLDEMQRLSRQIDEK